jgi:hypothetical protein
MRTGFQAPSRVGRTDTPGICRAIDESRSEGAADVPLELDISKDLHVPFVPPHLLRECGSCFFRRDEGLAKVDASNFRIRRRSSALRSKSAIRPPLRSQLHN